ncbi:MAG: hypothetical protein WD535_00165 [Thermaerobacterales bacterium]
MLIGPLILLILLILTASGWLTGYLNALGLNRSTALAGIAILIAGRFMGLGVPVPTPARVLSFNAGTWMLAVLALIVILGPYARQVRRQGLIALLAAGAAAGGVDRLLPDPPHLAVALPSVYLLAAAAGTTAYLVGRNRTLAVAAAIGGPPVVNLLQGLIVAISGPDAVARISGTLAFDAGILAAIIAGTLVELVGDQGLRTGR